jgi:hypothetical protein
MIITGSLNHVGGTRVQCSLLQSWACRWRCGYRGGFRCCRAVDGAAGPGRARLQAADAGLYNRTINIPLWMKKTSIGFVTVIRLDKGKNWQAFKNWFLSVFGNNFLIPFALECEYIGTFLTSSVIYFLILAFGVSNCRQFFSSTSILTTSDVKIITYLPYLPMNLRPGGIPIWIERGSFLWLVDDISREISIKFFFTVFNVFLDPVSAAKPARRLKLQQEEESVTASGTKRSTRKAVSRF